MSSGTYKRDGAGGQGGSHSTKRNRNKTVGRKSSAFSQLQSKKIAKIFFGILPLYFNLAIITKPTDTWECRCYAMCINYKTRDRKEISPNLTFSERRRQSPELRRPPPWSLGRGGGCRTAGCGTSWTRCIGPDPPRPERGRGHRSCWHPIGTRRMRGPPVGKKRQHSKAQKKCNHENIRTQRTGGEAVCGWPPGVGIRGSGGRGGRRRSWCTRSPR